MGCSETPIYQAGPYARLGFGSTLTSASRAISLTTSNNQEEAQEGVLETSLPDLPVISTPFVPTCTQVMSCTDTHAHILTCTHHSRACHGLRTQLWINLLCLLKAANLISLLVIWALISAQKGPEPQIFVSPLPKS